MKRLREKKLKSRSSEWRKRQTEKDLQKLNQFKLKAADALSEANRRFADAAKSKDFDAVSVAQGLLKTTYTKMKTVQMKCKLA